MYEAACSMQQGREHGSTREHGQHGSCHQYVRSWVRNKQLVPRSVFTGRRKYGFIVTRPGTEGAFRCCESNTLGRVYVAGGNRSTVVPDCVGSVRQSLCLHPRLRHCGSKQQHIQTYTHARQHISIPQVRSGTKHHQSWDCGNHALRKHARLGCGSSGCQTCSAGVPAQCRKACKALAADLPRHAKPPTL